MSTAINLSQTGLDRRLKRHLLKEPQTFLATCTPGFEGVLMDEIKQLDAAQSFRSITGGVEFAGPFDLVYYANLRLRTANRVIMRIGSFTARSYPELFNKAKKIPWELHCGFASKVSLSVTAKTSRLHHTDNITKALFDACRDHMKALGRTVALTDASPIVFFVRMHEDECTISIDSSGDLLYKRGYRQESGDAPIRETLAASLLDVCEWRQYPAIIDPFCGSGVFLIEAAMATNGIQPGGNRHFSFEAWPGFHAAKWARIRSTPGTRAEITPMFFGSDIDQTAVTAARANAHKARITDSLTLTRLDCRMLSRPAATTGPGLIIANPPYGHRIGDPRQLVKLYQAFGDRLRQEFSGWRYGFIIADPAFEKALALRVNRRIAFVNGGLRVSCIIGTV